MTNSIIEADSANEAYLNILWQLQNFGNEVISRDGDSTSKTLELLNCVVVINNPQLRHIFDKDRKWSNKCAAAEFAWYMTANPMVSIIAKYIKNWSLFSDDGINVNSQYGAIWHSQVLAVIDRLRNDRNSRRATIQIGDAKYANYNGKDMPCTCTLTFAIRDNKLNMTTFMRSNDVVWGFSTDQYAFTCLQELIANELGVQLGTYTHIAASMHIYERHFNLLDTMSYDSEMHKQPMIQSTTTYTNFWQAKDNYWFDKVDNDWFIQFVDTN